MVVMLSKKWVHLLLVDFPENVMRRRRKGVIGVWLTSVCCWEDLAEEKSAGGNVNKWCEAISDSKSVITHQGDLTLTITVLYEDCSMDKKQREPTKASRWANRQHNYRWNLLFRRCFDFSLLFIPRYIAFFHSDHTHIAYVLSIQTYFLLSYLLPYFFPLSLTQQTNTPISQTFSFIGPISSHHHHHHIRQEKSREWLIDDPKITLKTFELHQFRFFLLLIWQ